MESQILQVMLLLPTGNSQGGHFFLNFHTRRLITHFTRNVILIPTRICKFLWRLAEQPPISVVVLDGMQHEAPEAKPKNEESDED